MIGEANRAGELVKAGKGGAGMIGKAGKEIVGSGEGWGKACESHWREVEGLGVMGEP
ncbi:hypothetical protein Acr_17g0000400 [Actinidia rufa]|uniref:Uncharacterized protein n=1 Tax=Actinidia rufa TaxID=165716 RepID=A0A7J0G158_9ERIC|nr:hypothetical protein Acr_17g0000400 [Actinidia rufa]